MSAITIRNLPDETHDALRGQAALWGKSVESLVREILVWAGQEGKRGKEPAGMSEASAAFLTRGEAAPGFETLWGALRGTVHVPDDSDLAAPTGEVWQADEA